MTWWSKVFRRTTAPVTAPDREALDTQLRTGLDRAGAGKPEEAEQIFRELLENDPLNADALYFLAVIAVGTGRSLEAFDLCQKATSIRPNDPAIWFLLSMASHHLSLREETVKASRAVVALDPGNALARNNLGAALVDNGLFDEGLQVLERLLASGYETVQVQANLGVVYRDHGRMPEAIVAARRAAELAPEDKSAYTNYLFCLNYSEHIDATYLFDEHRKFGARFVKPYVEPSLDAEWPRRLRVGYVSPDFRNHVVACFFEPILAHHDRERFEVFCYYTHRMEDHVTERLRGLSEHWIECVHLSDAEIASRVRDDRIDILVDLAGHTGDNRILVFAAKPAPIQATYLGYPGTTGIAAIDYRISDARADPPAEADALSAERIVRMQPTYFCYRLPPDGPDPGPLPARATGQVTFGCFNNLPKVSDAFLDAAARILNVVPGSRLKLKSRTLSIPHVAERIRKRFRAANIEDGRVDLVGWAPSFEGHLSIYREIDVALDSFPYNGATTTCEALWMGVPVVSFSGDRHAGRMGASLLSAVGLQDLVAEDVEGYCRSAILLAGDLERLEKLRSGLRARVQSSPLTDETGFTRSLEDRYVEMFLKKLNDSSSRVASGDEDLSRMRQGIADLRAAGRKIDAEETCKKLLEIRPDDMEALEAIWDLSYETRNHGVAVEWLRRGIAVNGSIPMLHYMMGYSLMEQGNMPDAAASFRQALALDPSMSKAHNNLGCALEAAGNFGEAVDCYRRAIDLDPVLADALYNLGNAHRQQGDVDNAIDFIGRALKIQAARVDWRCNFGDLLCLKLRLDEALESYDAALALDSTEARAHSGRAWVLQQLGRTDEAEPHYSKAMELSPKDPGLHSSRLLSLHYRRGDETLVDEHAAWAARHGRGFGKQAARAAHERRPERRMNIGYFSPDFKRHSTASFMEPLLAAHDRKKFKVFCYSNVSFPDAVTQRFQGLCEEWRDISRAPDDSIADRLRADRIDVLVDLAGHTAGGRLQLFARKLAPVQVTWLGYPNTTGLAAIDYRLTDAIADPPGDSDRNNIEKLIRLEGGFLCFGAPSGSPDIEELPMLGAGHVTFGCFNNLAKLTPAMVAHWSRILAALPGSRLKLKSFGFAAPSARSWIAAQFAQHGIESVRLQIHGPEESFESHLGEYGEVDIGLDVYPYNGTATTCEALWMGVPVITLAGPTHVSRVGASILAHAGLDELVASSPEQYVQKALSLARDTGRLRPMRAGMRECLLASPLMDGARFARSLEDAYVRMWDQWVREEEQAEAANPLPLMVAEET